MGLRRRFTLPLQPAKDIETDFWKDVFLRIRDGRCIPIISNSFRIEQIFRGPAPAEEANPDAGELSPFEQLTQVWANEIGYPDIDSHSLPRVAQYFTTEQMDDSETSKLKYLTFLSNFLLALAEDDNPGYSELVNEIKGQIHNLRFTDIVRQLDYPRFRSESEDPFGLLASLPIPIYITTSYFSFLEEALARVGKVPHTQVCFWSGQPSHVSDQHQIGRDFFPTEANPLVFHLFGHEDYPKSMVMSEDDYFNFLISIAQDRNIGEPVIPLNLRSSLATSQLILLGYQEYDWDFRVLFKLIQTVRNTQMTTGGIIVRQRPSEDFLSKEAVRYLENYFNRHFFTLNWMGSEEFILKLWNEWKRQRAD